MRRERGRMDGRTDERRRRRSSSSALLCPSPSYSLSLSSGAPSLPPFPVYSDFAAGKTGVLLASGVWLPERLEPYNPT